MEQFRFTASEKMLNTAMPQNMMIAKEPRPPPSTSAPQRERNTTLKTNVYTHSIIIGCTKLQKSPSIEPR